MKTTQIRIYPDDATYIRERARKVSMALMEDITSAEVISDIVKIAKKEGY